MTAIMGKNCERKIAKKDADFIFFKQAYKNIT